MQPSIIVSPHSRARRFTQEEFLLQMQVANAVMAYKFWKRLEEEVAAGEEPMVCAKRNVMALVAIAAERLWLPLGPRSKQESEVLAWYRAVEEQEKMEFLDREPHPV